MTLAVAALSRPSTAEQVADAMRDALMRGEIPPGARLREAALAEAFRVSRNTVREAIRILAIEGLIRQNLHRGALVAELSESELSDVYRARKAIELSGVQVVKPESAALARMRTATDRMRRSRAAADLADADLEFHTSVVAAIESDRLNQFYRLIQAELRLTRAWERRARGGREQMYDTHRAVVDALDAGDTTGASRLLNEINAQGEARLQEAIRTRVRGTGGTAYWPPKEGHAIA